MGERTGFAGLKRVTAVERLEVAKITAYDFGLRWRLSTSRKLGHEELSRMVCGARKLDSWLLFRVILVMTLLDDSLLFLSSWGRRRMVTGGQSWWLHKDTRHSDQAPIAQGRRLVEAFFREAWYSALSINTSCVG